MKNFLSTIVFALVLVSLGLAAGYFAAWSRPAQQAQPDPAAAGPREFTPQTLKNLGVEVGVARLTSFVQSREVQAVVQDAPLNLRPLVAPLPGIVRSVAVRPGSVVGKRSPIVIVVRDAIPRPELKLTGEMFTPVSEALHAAFAELRSATGEMEIAEKELARLEKINASTATGGAPLISRRTLIDLGYQRDKAQRRVTNARVELEHHGLSGKEIDAVAGGDHLPGGRDLWRRVLTVHGLWTPRVAAVHGMLPEETRDLPWTIAILGELSAAGIVDDAFVAMMKEAAGVRGHFGAAAGLLLQGQTVDRIRGLGEMGALESTFVLRAPGDDVDWDVAEIAVRPGQHVAAGDTIALLHDPREMWLRLEPVGDEIALVIAALRAGTSFTATPMLAGTGPELRDLRIERLATRAAGRQDTRGEVAFVRCTNQRLEGGQSDVRSWAVREGLRYVVRVPSVAHQDVFVLAKDAVAKEGPDRVVYLQDGNSFRPRPVHVIFESADEVVVANDGALFPDDKIVTSGAFLLGVAMQQGADGGHGHTHDH